MKAMFSDSKHLETGATVRIVSVCDMQIDRLKETELGRISIHQGSYCISTVECLFEDAIFMLESALSAGEGFIDLRGLQHDANEGIEKGRIGATDKEIERFLDGRGTPDDPNYEEPIPF